MPNFENAFNTVCELVKDFKENEHFYLSPKYNEQQARKDFIDKFFIALGWDVNHTVQKNPHKQEVLIEQTLDNQRRPDYTFYLEPNFNEPKFFVEAKKPSHDLLNSDYYFQAISYARFANTPVTVLTDFQEFHILDSRYKPNINTVLKEQNHLVFKYTDYADREKFSQIYYLFSRDDVANNSIKDYADKLTASDKKRKKSGYTKGELLSIDEEFLLYLDNIRVRLAKAFKKADSSLSSEELTEATQRTIDRLVFIRFLEDKNIEPEDFVSKLGTSGKAWSDFITVCRKLDAKYNGIVFKEHFIDNQNFGGPELSEFKNVCFEFSRKNSQSFNYNLIPIHILGSIYERFLGKVVNATAQRVKVEEKPEVRKAGGVYYTPKYIVDYIVDNTVGKILRNENETLPRWRGIKGVEEDGNISSVSSPLALGGYLNNGNPEDGKDNTPLVPKLQLGNGKGLTPAQISKLRFADIACGSGSFLIGVFETLLDYHNNYYWLHQEEAKKDGCIFKDGVPFLSIKQKQNILLNNIYGVDIDPQAVEVTQLSLALKMLEDESLATANEMQVLFHEKILPDLSKNIICGNSLIGTDIIYENSSEGLFERKRRITIEEERKLNPMDFEKRFPHIFKSPQDGVSFASRLVGTGDKGGGSINPDLSSPLAKQTHEVLLGGELKNGNPEYKGGFDAIVGNPPYIKEYTDRSAFEYVKKSKLKKYYQGKMDLWYFFACFGLDILKENGLLGFIAPNNWITNAGASIMRNKVISESQIINIVDFGDYMVFNNASIQTMILILKNSKNIDDYFIDFRKIINSKLNKTISDSILAKEQDNNLLYLEPQITKELYINKFLTFDTDDNNIVLNKMKSAGKFFLQNNEATNGIHPHHGYVGKSMIGVLGNKYPVGTGIFALNDIELENLKLNELEKTIIKPFYSNSELLDRYYINTQNKEWIIYTTSDFKNPKTVLPYPNIKNHLDKFVKVITSDNKPYGLHRCREERFFKGQKIISLRKCIKPTFIYSDDDCYLSAAFYIIKTDRVNLKYLTALLNSALIKFWLKHSGKMQGNIYQVDKEPLMQIPLMETDKETENRIVSLVNEMLEAKKQLQTVKTDRDKTYYENKCTDLDHAIDSEVYKLYGLTLEEIKIVEGRE